MRILTTSWVRSLLEFMSSAHTVVPLGLLHMRRLQSWFAQLRLDPVRHCLRMFCRSHRSRGWTWSIGETYSMCPDVWHFGEKSLLLYSSLQRWFSDWMGKERARLGQWGCVFSIGESPHQSPRARESAAALTAFSLLGFGVSMYWSGQTIELQ